MRPTTVPRSECPPHAPEREGQVRSCFEAEARKPKREGCTRRCSRDNVLRGAKPPAQCRYESRYSPPFEVCTMRPPVPTAQPRSGSTNQTSFSPCAELDTCGCHEAAPSTVLRINPVPFWPTA